MRLTKRREFLAAARARKQARAGFVLQARRRAAEEAAFAPPESARVGFTASKKVGGAVVRNRAKRRLRALAAAHLPTLARPGWDYVLIARAEETVARPYAALEADLIEAMAAIHAPAKKGGGRRPGAAAPPEESAS